MSSRMSQNSAIRVVGVDVGAADAKIVSPHSQIAFPSAVKHGKTLVESMNGRDEYGEWVAGGHVYSVGAKLNGVTTGRGPWYSSNARVAVAHHGISASLEQDLSDNGCDISHLVFTSPYHQVYRKDGTRDESGIEKQEIAFSQQVKAVKGLENRIGKVKVLAEGIAAVLDFRMEMDGSFVNNARDRICIVDIGGSTTELIYVDGAKIDIENSTNFKIGINKVFTKLRAEFDGLDDYFIREAVRTGCISICGKKENCEPVRAKALGELAEELIYQLQTRILAPEMYSKVLIVGGGAHILQSYLTAESLFPDDYKRLSLDKRNFIVTPENPEFANARGAYKYAVWLQNKELAA